MQRRQNYGMKPFNKATIEELERAWDLYQQYTYDSPGEEKTGFDFGATRYALGYGQEFFTPNRVLSQEWFCHIEEWRHESLDHHDWLNRGEVFITESDCQNYCDYLNSKK